ncbi:hypothetical protein MKX08_010110, partial [Trichoderma sp. CBMAI-0020]
MRGAVWSAIATIWPRCILDPAVVDPGTAVDIIPGETEAQEIVWRAYQEPLFDQVTHTYHMDIKPGNFILDNQENLVLIDWEQNGAPATTLAPEADGTWDVEEQDSKDSGSMKLVYTKYTGPERRNMPEGSGQESFNVWNVFPEWQVSCPKALELAEVFALGRIMWMLLSQTASNFDEVEHPDDVQVTWTGNTNLPSCWVEIVENCMNVDPNNRPSLENLTGFWGREAYSFRWRSIYIFLCFVQSPSYDLGDRKQHMMLSTIISSIL